MSLFIIEFNFKFFQNLAPFWFLRCIIVLFLVEKQQRKKRRLIWFGLQVLPRKLQRLHHGMVCRRKQLGMVTGNSGELIPAGIGMLQIEAKDRNRESAGTGNQQKLGTHGDPFDGMKALCILWIFILVLIEQEYFCIYGFALKIATIASWNGISQEVTRDGKGEPVGTGSPYSSRDTLNLEFY